MEPTNDKHMADCGGVGDIEEAPSDKRPHKQDVAATDEGVSKEKILKLLKIDNETTASGPDSRPTTPTCTSTPDPASVRPDYPA